MIYCWTQEDYLKEMGVFFATANRWETGEAKVK